MHGIHTLVDLAKFYSAIPEFLASNDPEQRGSIYHRVIVAVSITTGVCGILAGIGIFAFVFLDEEARAAALDDYHGLAMIIPIILLLGVAGGCLGVALTCAFAPTSFLRGPFGKRWMNFIGTESIFAARSVCLTIAAIFIGTPILLAFMIEWH